MIGYDPLRGLQNLLMPFDVLEVGMQDKGSLKVLHEFFLLSGKLI